MNGITLDSSLDASAVTFHFQGRERHTFHVEELTHSPRLQERYTVRRESLLQRREAVVRRDDYYRHIPQTSALPGGGDTPILYRDLLTRENRKSAADVTERCDI